jgi:hypothetical protein
MGYHSGKMIFFSFLIAMAGLVMLITGARTDDPQSPFAGFDKIGIMVLIAGGLLFVLGIYFLRRG